MDISHNIKRRRLELNLSQQELAQSAGYRSRSAIAKIEAGDNDIPLSKLEALAHALDTTPERLIAGASEPAETPLTTTGARRRHGEGRTAAIVLAGGKSTRNMQNIPNQFIDVLGKPVISYCLDTYQAHPLIDDIYVVCLDGWENILTAYARRHGITKLRGTIPGGSSGILSVRNGIRHLITEGFGGKDIIILQESTRPLVTQEMISKLLHATSAEGFAIICESMNDYVQFTKSGKTTSYIDRSLVVDLQSPEAYTIEKLQEIFALAGAERHRLSESCVGMLMNNLGFSLNFCEGNHNNIKIVRQEDVAIFSALLKTRA